MIHVIVGTAIVGAASLFLHFTVIADPNAGWPFGEWMYKSVGIWWVVLAMALAAFQQGFISWLALRSKRKVRLGGG